MRAYWLPDTKLSVFKTLSHLTLTALQTDVLTVALPLAPFHRCRNRGRQMLITSLKVTQHVTAGSGSHYLRLPRLGLKGMEPHSALITFNKCKGSSRERNKGCSKEITRSAPRDGMYLSHLYLAWPRRKRAHGRKDNTGTQRRRASRNWDFPKAQALAPVVCPCHLATRGLFGGTQEDPSKTWRFSWRSSGWPVPLDALLCHPLSLHSFLEFPGAGWPAAPWIKC